MHAKFEKRRKNGGILIEKRYFNSSRRPKCPKPLFVGAKHFMKATKKGDAFLIYNFPSPDVEPHPHEIPSKYQEFKDVFEKQYADTLPKH